MTEGTTALVELKPCLFCEEPAPYVVENLRGDTVSGRQVECGYCMARGPERRTGADAITAWNRRTPAISEEADGPCPECGDSGYVQRGAHQWVCDCPCGQDVHRQRAGAPLSIPPATKPDEKGLDAAAEEYVFNPDSPTQSNHHCSWVDPEEAFKAGAQWALRASPGIRPEENGVALLTQIVNDLETWDRDLLEALQMTPEAKRLGELLRTPGIREAVLEEAANWLIERRVTPPQWSTVRDPTGAGAFYSDVQRAHRFPTKVAAEEAMRRMSITPEERGQYFVSEHVWIGAERTYFGMDEQDFEDFLDDTLTDSLDMDWTGRDGAKAIIHALKITGTDSGGAK